MDALSKHVASKRKPWRRALPLALASAVVASLLVLGGAEPARAHGYVAGGAVTSRAAMSANADRGAVQYEPQSLEAPKGFPAAGPADGQIASAGGKFGGNLDAQSSTRWAKNPVRSGPIAITWTYTAAHATSQWRYYLTTPGWDQNAPLARKGFELIKTVDHDGSKASNNLTHSVTIPANRTGYHVLLAVWDIADTANAFYNVIDLDVSGTAPPADVQVPTTPTGLSASATSSAVSLSWSPSSDDVAVSGYEVFRDGTRIATTTTAGYADSSVKPDTSYRYEVRAADAAGNVSARSASLTVTTKAAPAQDTAPPVAPVLHAHDLTSTSVKVHWEGSTDDTGVTGYELFRNGSRILSTGSGTSTYVDQSLAGERTYGYTVRALDAAGNASAPSNTVTVTTPKASDPDPTGDREAPSKPTGLAATLTTATQVALSWRASSDNVGVARYDVYRFIEHGAPRTKVGTTTQTRFTDSGPDADTRYHYLVSAVDAAWNVTDSDVLHVITPGAATPATWNPRGTYAKGDLVTYQGQIYQAVQSHTGNGDPNWINAPSLWFRR
ncbi:lytic polysaccharide monooxygenase [Nocardioides sp. WS12]|uniref:lytic polysaccharide monooxygenase n=1 Tax=Nocardioides sp. WS12 TaxID=2486272 RepID=UPI0015FBF85D|nr:lytic polysaccharide monooxygenase [Nocardioides sp. WS12]